MIRCIVATLVLVAITTEARSVTAQSLDETKKIEMLIGSVHDLKEASFIRNGAAYDGKAAADHLRQKWSSAGNRIKTARDFIRDIASASSVSGKPYLIRFKDKTEVKSGDFLLKQLDQIEAPTTAPSTGPAAR